LREPDGQLQLAVREGRDHIGRGNESWLYRGFLPESCRVYCRGLTGSSFQEAMLRVHSRACTNAAIGTDPATIKCSGDFLLAGTWQRV
jgi:hypothetical protein